MPGPVDSALEQAHSGGQGVADMSLQDASTKFSDCIKVLQEFSPTFQGPKYGAGVQSTFAAGPPLDNWNDFQLEKLDDALIAARQAGAEYLQALAEFRQQR